MTEQPFRERLKLRAKVDLDRSERQSAAPLGGDVQPERQEAQEKRPLQDEEGNLLQRMRRSSFDQYQICEKIGQGGMGLVYRVEHKELRKSFAMKMLHPEAAADAINLKRFQQECASASMLSHPNLVTIYDSGIAPDNSPYLVMDLLVGQSLEKMLNDEGYIELDRFFGIMLQICEALQHAHFEGVIHRDIKPSNIMITGGASTPEIVKIVDFGIARVMQPTSRTLTRLTQANDVLGSPVYMSPEQCLGLQLDERSDIYSLGVVMYESLAGHPPFDAENAIQTIVQQLQKEPRPINRLRSDAGVPAALEQVIMQCLEKDPDARFQTIDDLRRALETARAHPQKTKHSMFRALRKNIRAFVRRTANLPSVSSVALFVTSLIFFCLAFVFIRSGNPYLEAAFVEPDHIAPLTTISFSGEGPFGISLNKRSWRDYLEAGTQCSSQQNYEGAIANWKTALLQADQLQIPHREQATLHQYIGDTYNTLNGEARNDAAPLPMYGKMAEDHFNSALQLVRGLKGCSSFEVKVLDSLIQAQQDQNKTSDAAATAKRRLEKMEASASAYSADDVIAARGLYGMLLASLGHDEQANEQFRLNIALNKKHFGKGLSDEVSNSYYGLAENLFKQAKYEEALAVYNDELARFLVKYGNDSAYLETPLASKVETLKLLGRYKEAAEASKILKQVQEKNQTPSSTNEDGLSDSSDP